MQLFCRLPLAWCPTTLAFILSFIPFSSGSLHLILILILIRQYEHTQAASSLAVLCYYAHPLFSLLYVLGDKSGPLSVIGMDFSPVNIAECKVNYLGEDERQAPGKNLSF